MPAYLSPSLLLPLAPQERLKEASGKEGMGAGYEDVRVGFYRVSRAIEALQRQTPQL